MGELALFLLTVGVILLLLQRGGAGRWWGFLIFPILLLPFSHSGQAALVGGLLLGGIFFFTGGRVGWGEREEVEVAEKGKGVEGGHSPEETQRGENGKGGEGEEIGEGESLQSEERREGEKEIPFQNPHLQRLLEEYRGLLESPVREWVVQHQLEELGKLWGELLKKLDQRGVTTTQLVQLNSYLGALKEAVASFRKVEGQLTGEELKEFVKLLEELRQQMLFQLLRFPIEEKGEFKQELELLRRQLARWSRE
ncbi:MAG: hypothetical protein ABGW77_05070 [Campylobacterales bacterium]